MGAGRGSGQILFSWPRRDSQSSASHLVGEVCVRDYVGLVRAVEGALSPLVAPAPCLCFSLRRSRRGLGPWAKGVSY